MGIGDDIKHGAEKAAGKAKEAFGDLTNNERMEREGKADQLEADVKNTGADIRDGAEDAMDDVKAGIEDMRRD
ncbi:MAG TPA: CsbD family protein [Actinomycetales bacterium]|nr:CsbD family protein [Actinomycetales bacterium]